RRLDSLRPGPASQGRPRRRDRHDDRRTRRRLAMYLVTGEGGGIGSVSRQVVELLLDDGGPVRAMVHRDDDRATALRDLGAEVVVGDLTNPQDVANAMAGVDRMFFNMSVSPDYLTATSIVCAVALEAPVEAIVNMS